MEAWKAGPFDDAQFSLALRALSGRKILYVPDMAVYHRVYPYRLSYEFVRRQSYWQGYSKAIYRKMYPGDSDLNALERERDVLKSILLRVIPRALLDLLITPRKAKKKLWLVAVVLSHVVLGYATGKWPERLGFTRSYFS
jgi:GT2 family glycosyltransferase